MARTTTPRPANERILSVLRRGPKRGLTAETIAERAGLNLNTTRTVLWSLTSSESVVTVGTTSPTGSGRPANLYALAA